jgi:hypothetical protein
LCYIYVVKPELRGFRELPLRGVIPPVLMGFGFAFVSANLLFRHGHGFLAAGVLCYLLGLPFCRDTQRMILDVFADADESDSNPSTAPEPSAQ